LNALQDWVAYCFLGYLTTPFQPQSLIDSDEVGGARNASGRGQKFWLVSLKEIDHYEDLCMGGRIILK
jgi:hypothetical protein